MGFKEVKIIQACFRDAKIRHDDADQYSRSTCLPICGLPETETADLNKLVLDFADDVLVNISPRDIVALTGWVK